MNTYVFEYKEDEHNKLILLVKGRSLGEAMDKLKKDGYEGNKLMLQSIIPNGADVFHLEIK
jgi:hypothetical protein